MRLEEALNQIEQQSQNNLKKRYACSHCGKTWVEIVGNFLVNINIQESTYFRMGSESENCQNCQFRVRTCPECGSNDAYEINFQSAAPETPLSFNRIRIVSKT